MSILQRFRDWHHERRIKRLSALCKEAMAAGDKPKARMYWWLMVDAIKARSEGQISRHERKMGPRI